jgi:endoglucanase
MAHRALSRGQITAIAVAGSLAFIAVVAFVFSILVTPGTSNPFPGRSLYVYPDSTAAQAVATASGDEKAAFERIAQTPTAIWITPEQHPTDSVADFVRDVAVKASDQDALPTFVVYGIPNRDCSNQSAGGTTAEDYPNWLGAIKDGIGGLPAVIILEPDSLSLAPSCGNVDERVAQISSAIDALSADDTTIYLDAGHSNFLSANEQADLLERAGVKRVRGFASNVSNFNTTDDEVAYDEQVSSLLGGSHFVIDTGRNGNGSNGEWCNPSGRALGDAPASVDGSDGHDANLWIKNPGESDGECNGGPPAGQWWPEAALALANG